MASIKEIKLKAIKTFPGMECEGYSCNIYMDNKKIGTAINYGSGIETEVHIEPEYEEEFNKRVNEYLRSQPDYLQSADIFIDYVFNLSLMETEFKKRDKKLKRDYPDDPRIMTAFVRVFTIKALSLDIDDNSSETMNYKKVEWEGTTATKESLEEVKKEYKGNKFLIFTSLDDFDINDYEEGI